MTLSGSSLAGASISGERVKNDFYATPFDATEKILQKVFLEGSILEPACGEGHIAKVLREFYPEREIVATDLVQRADIFGIGAQYGVDFLKHDFGRTFDNIVTNPPYSLAQEFVERAIDISHKKVLMLLKIQFLEGIARKRMFEKTPPKNVWVFSKRINPLPNGKSVRENGKKMASTMCFAWFEWDKQYSGAPQIKWI